MRQYYISHNDKRLLVRDHSRRVWGVQDWRSLVLVFIALIMITAMSYIVYGLPEWSPVPRFPGSHHYNGFRGNDAFFILVLAIPMLAIFVRLLKTDLVLLRLSKHDLRIDSQRYTIDRSHEIEWRNNTITFKDRDGQIKRANIDERVYGREVVKDIKTWMQSHFSFIER